MVYWFSCDILCQCTCTCSVWWNYYYYVKNGHFAQNYKFWQFSSYHHSKVPRALGFIITSGTSSPSTKESRVTMIGLQSGLDIKWLNFFYHMLPCPHRIWVLCTYFSATVAQCLKNQNWKIWPHRKIDPVFMSYDVHCVIKYCVYSFKQ